MTKKSKSSNKDASKAEELKGDIKRELVKKIRPKKTKKLSRGK